MQASPRYFYDVYAVRISHSRAFAATPISTIHIYPGLFVLVPCGGKASVFAHSESAPRHVCFAGNIIQSGCITIISCYLFDYERQWIRCKLLFVCC